MANLPNQDAAIRPNSAARDPPSRNITANSFGRIRSRLIQLQSLPTNLRRIGRHSVPIKNLTLAAQLFLHQKLLHKNGFRQSSSHHIQNIKRRSTEREGLATLRRLFGDFYGANVQGCMSFDKVTPAISLSPSLSKAPQAFS